VPKVENDFKHPAWVFGVVRLILQWLPVAVLDPLQIAVGCADSPALTGFVCVYALAILRSVVIVHSVSLPVIARRDQPLGNVTVVVWIAVARFRARAINRQDIISSELAPKYNNVRCPSPFFDPRKQALNPRTIKSNPVP